MFGRSKKIQDGVLSQVHTILANTAQDTIEQIVKKRVRWGGVTVRFSHQGPGPRTDVDKYKATVRGYCTTVDKKATHGVHATFDVFVCGTSSVEFEEGSCHEFSYEYRHEYWGHYWLRVEKDGSVLTKPKHSFPQDPWAKADGTQVVLAEQRDF